MATILEFLVSILLFLDSIIYSLISWVYQIILVLCRIDILGNTNAIDELINRLYIIIGVIVLFLVAYSLLKSMVNPDDTLKNKKGPVTIIKDVLISIVLIALVPTIFQFVIGFQNALLTQNTLGKIILGTQGNSEASGVEDGGMFFASNVLSAFLHPSECPQADDGSYDCSNAKVATGSIGIPFIFSITTETTNFNEIWSELTSSGSLLGITTFAYDITHDGNVTYYYIISTVVGVFVLLVLLSYCIDVAIRVVKLAVYELIAPLPILLRIVPNEQGNKVFSNWLKACISTYLEVFIRLAILFFAVFLAKVVVDNFTTIFAPLVSGEAGWTVVLFAQMFLILGIILFIKQAPGLIKDITGLDGGKYGFFTGLKGAMQTGAIFGAGATAAVRNWNDKTAPDGSNKSAFNRLRSAIGGAGSAAFRSFRDPNEIKDFKSMKANASKAAEEAIKAHNVRTARNARYAATGENRFTDMWNKAKIWSGAEQSRAILEARKKVYDEAVGFQKQLFDLASDDKTVIALEGQKKAASEKIIDKDQIKREIIAARREELRKLDMPEGAIDDQIAMENDELERKSSETVASLRREQAATIDMYDNLIKIAKLKVIQEKIKKGDGRYKSVVETAKVFKSQHMDDPTIANMEDIIISEEQASQLDRVLNLSNPSEVERQMDIIKGKITDIRDTDIIRGHIGLTSDNEKMKIASGDVAVEIAKLVQGEKGKESEKK